MLSGKNILLGVTGSIAAYKSTYLVRLLLKAGAQVKVILTPAARDFVTPLTLSTLSKNLVLWEYYDPEDEQGEWNNHVELGLWANLMLVAPATSNTLSKMATARADNLLLGAYLSAKCPVYFAPAMDLDMYRHPANAENIQKLENFGNTFISVGSGELASGLEGEGRMAEPEAIVDFIEKDLKRNLPLSGKKVLVNAGPTHEPIDPVRFLGNHSTGKMGIALAESACRLGAEVNLILGPTHLRPAEKNIRVTEVQTAQEMMEQCQEKFPEASLTILAAAISDYRPVEVSQQKIKKSGKSLSLKFTKNPDILATLGKQKTDDQVLIGFALETENALDNARKKVHKKKCDLIVVNLHSDEGSGFGHDTNEVQLIDRQERIKKLEKKSKNEIADEILDYSLKHFRAVL